MNPARFHLPCLRLRRSFTVTLLIITLTGLFFLTAQPHTRTVQAVAPPDGLTELASQAAEEGTVRVIVQLDLPFEPESQLETPGAVQMQQMRIQQTQAQLLESLAENEVTQTAVFQTIPFMALEVDSDGLAALAALPEIVSIEADIPVPPALSSSIPVIGADDAWASGYTGAGQTVAILDTGVQTSHPAFNGRIVSEACYSTNSSGSVSVCPGGVEASTAPGSGNDCTAAASGYVSAQGDCSHGTHVAGIAAGSGATNGVAKEANIIAVQIFSLFTTTTYCGGSSSCALTWTSDQIAGLERIYALRNTYDIAAVNMSLGGGSYSNACDSDSRKAIIDNLRAAGIATIIAAGNNSYKTAVSAPGCISTAVTVGATEDNDDVAYFSNISPLIDLVAPGVSIYAAIPNSSYGTKSGTSMSTPHVAGAWAVYKQMVPGATVDDVLTAFQSSGVLVDDLRSGGVATDMPRLNLGVAVAQYQPGLTVNKSASAPYVLPGSALSYTIQVTNNTSVTAQDVIITDTVPANWTLTSGSLSGDASFTGINSGDLITWNTGVDLAPGQTLQRTVSGMVNPAMSGGQIENIAFATGTGMVDVRQGSVTTAVPQLASCELNEGFESGTLSNIWAVETTEDGRVSISSDTASSGSRALVLDDRVPNGSYSTANAILTFDLSDQGEATLSFDWRDLGDEYDAAYDGVFIRESINDPWTKVYDFGGNIVDVYQSATLPLHTLAATNGLNFTDQFQIKFGFYDNYAFNPTNVSGGDGYAIDNLSMSCVAAGLTVEGTLNSTTFAPGTQMMLTWTIANPHAETAVNTTLSAALPTGLQFTGPVIVNGSGGSVATQSNDLPTVASGMTIPAGGQVTVSLPVSVATGLTGGSSLSVTGQVSSDSYAHNGSDTVTALVANLPPVAQNDTAVTTRATAVTVSVLANDTDANGDSLTITDIGQPSAGGTATSNGTTITFTPNSTFAGQSTMSYTVSDGMGQTQTAVLTITVQNEPPTATDDSSATPANQLLIIPVLWNDVDLNEHPLTVTAVSTAANGTALVQDNMIRYTANSGFNGQETLTYTVSDGHGGSDSGTITITVGPTANAAPATLPDTVDTGRDTAVFITPLSNDLDPNQHPLTLHAIGTPTAGTAVLQNGQIRFTPLNGYIGTVTLSYTVRDSLGATSSETVTIRVGLADTEMITVSVSGNSQTFTTRDNRLSVTIPVGALPPLSAEIAYTVLNAPVANLPAPTANINFALNLSLSGQGFMLSPSFSPPLEVTVRYDPTLLPDNLPEQALQLYYFDETRAEWVKIEIAERDLVNNEITVLLSHFTDFAVAGSNDVFIPFLSNNP